MIHRVLNSWNHSVPHCHWLGVTCDVRHERVSALSLQGQSLLGSISPYLGNLSFLKSIKFEDNRYGEIPKEISHLIRLRHLNMSENTLTGHFPANLSHCSKLVNLSVRDNRLTGQIPKELDSLRNLVFLNLGGNNFTGNIPSSIGNLSLLNTLSLGHNYLMGYLPRELGTLIKLSFFSVSQNYLSGTFPPSLFNISTLKAFSTTSNFFLGNLPVDIGLKMPSLQFLLICGNEFSGIIPNSIANATKLELLCLSANEFRGQVPINFGNLPNLLSLLIATNLLGQNSAGDLDFISSLANCSRLQRLIFSLNNFGGELPKVIGDLSSQMQKLGMEFNKISGAVPLELGNLVNLYALDMEGNYFSGTIPITFGGFQNLQSLSLADNRLSGLIPSTIYNITSLYFLNLSKNNFDGTIPLSLGNCRNLQILDLSQNKLTAEMPAAIFRSSFSPIVLDLSHNSLTGALPVEIGTLKSIHAFNVSYNSNLSGEIPRTLGDCSSLEYLNMEGNSFHGSIPPTLASIKGLQYLDLSENQLSGEIRRDLDRITFLKYLNLSFNDLEGELPSNGVFANASLISLEGNRKLCGGIAALKLHSCVAQRKNNRKFGTFVILVPVLLAVVLSSSATFLLVYWRRVRRKRQQILSPGDDKFISVSFHELHRATGGFSQENLIGSGSFGFVYRGVLDQHGDRPVAVKVFDLQKNGASTSFRAECRALRNIRHRNLVPVITYCSSIDGKGEEFKAIVYEFMQNGSLDGWLHPELGETERSRSLNFAKRLNIAIDVATALDYLHNHTQLPIVHCDLKPSNILLDSNLTAHVGDFGLARLLLTCAENFSEQGISSSIAIKGSFGYAAQEYGMGSEASTAGDVYSYGILLLEMFTERRPTDDIFKDGLDLYNFVKMNFPEQVMEIVYQLLGEENRINVEPCNVEIGFDDNSRHLTKCLISIFRIGLHCSATLPNDRLNMNEVRRELLHIKDAFFAAKRHRAIPYRT